MKKILLCVSLFFISVRSFSQLAYIDFESGSPDSLITIDSSAGNIWQIGTPHKFFLDSAHSGLKAIVTDTINFYPPNNLSRFILKVPWINYPGEQSGVTLQLYYKMDADTLRDGGYIEYSTDDGLTWLNLGSPFLDVFPPLTDTLTGGVEGITGKRDWSLLNFQYCFQDNEDSLFLRFTFKSDVINDQREGWMIDDITVGATNCEGIQEVHFPNKFSNIFPNPISDISFLQIENQNSLINEVDFYDALGRKISTLNHPHQSDIPISKEKFGEGFFFYRIELANHKTDSGSFVVQ